MPGFLSRLQRRRSGRETLQAEDIVLRGGAQPVVKPAAKKRAQTSILLTNRDPSPDGLLAELVGFSAGKRKGDARSALESDPSALQGNNTPAWMNLPPKNTPQLDTLVSAARLVLYELYSEEVKASDVLGAVKRAVSAAARRLSDQTRFSSRDMQEAVRELHGLIAGKGPLQPLYDDPLVTDIYIDSFDRIRCLRLGQAIETPFKFRSAAEYQAFYTSALHSAGRVLSAVCPVVDCVLKDDWRSRVNAVHGSLRENGESSLVIRVPRLRYATLYDLLRSQTLPASLAAWMSELMTFGEANFLVMGPTGAGKTTLAAALLSAVGSDERVCTIEEIPEIFVSNCHLEQLITRAPDALGNGEVKADALLRAALHRAPHRVVVGEIRDYEGSLFLEALETGHSGSIATMHAVNPTEGLWRLLDVVSPYERAPLQVIQRRISRAIHIIVVLKRIDGRPCVVDVSEVLPSENGEFAVQSLIRYEGEMSGRRVWRKLVTDSRLIKALSDRGVELMTGPTLLPPMEPVTNSESEQGL